MTNSHGSYVKAAALNSAKIDNCKTNKPKTDSAKTVDLKRENIARICRKSDAQIENAANTALREYFDDLVEAQTSTALTDTAENIISASELDIAKIYQAERLLTKANAIDSLLVDSVTELNTETVVSAPLNNVLRSENEHQENAVFADTYNKGQTRSLAISLKDSLATRFQVILCEIANVTIAIPLVELGGIFPLTKISKIAKQPTWCAGILVKGSKKFNCVDASSWLLPQKHINDKSFISEYKFGIQIGKTEYVLCCNSISNTLELSKDDVKWRESINTRPWLAGLLKEKMCALIDGAQMLDDVLG